MKKENMKNIIIGLQPIIKNELKAAFTAWSVGSALLTISKALKK